MSQTIDAHQVLLEHLLEALLLLPPILKAMAIFKLANKNGIDAGIRSFQKTCAFEAE